MIKFLIKRNIRKAIKEVSNNCFELKCLLDTFKINKYEYAFVGGFVRHFFTKLDYTDVDIMVKIQSYELKSIVDYFRFKYDLNDFGGIKIHTEKGLNIDIWSFYDHKPFTSEYFPEESRTWENIPYTSFTSLDGATYTSNNKLYLGDIPTTLKTNTVMIYTCRNSHLDDIIIAKLYYYQKKGFTLSKVAKEELNRYMYLNQGKSKASKYLMKYNLSKDFIKESKALLKRCI